jgi:hypothetical protein
MKKYPANNWDNLIGRCDIGSQDRKIYRYDKVPKILSFLTPENKNILQ